MKKDNKSKVREFRWWDEALEDDEIDIQEWAMLNGYDNGDD